MIRSLMEEALLFSNGELKRSLCYETGSVNVKDNPPIKAMGIVKVEDFLLAAGTLFNPAPAQEVASICMIPELSNDVGVLLERDNF